MIALDTAICRTRSIEPPDGELSLIVSLGLPSGVGGRISPSDANDTYLFADAASSGRVGSPFGSTPYLNRPHVFAGVNLGLHASMAEAVDA